MATQDQLLALADGPWDGIVDAVAPTARQKGKYLLGQNIYPLDPLIGAGVVGRPGVRVMGAQLGAVGARRVQGVCQFTKDDGTELTVAVVGGRIYTLDWVNEIWTNVVTLANLATAVITLSTTAQVAFTVVTNKLHLSDGVNLSFLWDGTAGAGGLTKLTNSAVFYGQPWVYDGRLFGIKAAAPTTIVWSETDAPNTGYEAGGFTNAWKVTQSNQNRLYAGMPSNDDITLARARSATAVAGSPTTFSSAPNTDAIDDSVGTMSPFAVVRYNLGVVVLDADLHPQLLRAGGAGFNPLWPAMRETLKKIPRTAALAQQCMGVFYQPANLILLAVPDLGATECTMLLVFDAKRATPVPVGVWRGWEMTALAMVKSAAAASVGTPYLFHGDTTGYVYLHGNPEDSAPWDDFLASGTVPIDHLVQLQALGFDVKREKIFDRIDLSVRAFTRMTLEVSAQTSRGASSPQTIVVDSGVAGWDTALWDTMVWDVDASLNTEEAHTDVGIDEQGRWIKPLVRHRTLNEQFGVVGVLVTAYVTDDDPEIP